MKGTFKGWAKNIQDAQANAENYQKRLDAMCEQGHSTSTGEWKGTEIRRQAWNLVSASIAEALRLEALPTYQS